MSKSMLPKEMRGVMHVTGGRGIGKSFLCAQADFPKNILLMDYENKGEGIDEQIDFGDYYAVTRSVDSNPLGVYRETMSIINNIKPGDFSVAVLDNISHLELALRAEANNNIEEYANEYNLNITNIKKGRFGGLSSVVNFLISDQICNRLHAKGIRLIAITSHVKPRWGSAGPIPNKKRIKGADRWQELSILSLVLVPGNFAPIPAAIVMKEQLGLISIPDPSKMSDDEYEQYQRGEAGHHIERRLPLRLPVATFQAIRHYLHNPADLTKPKDGETPTAQEQSPYDDKLSEAQIAFMHDLVKHNEKKRADEKEAETLVEKIKRDKKTSELADEIRPLVDTMNLMEIVAVLNEKGISVTPPIVAEAVSKINKEKEA